MSDVFPYSDAKFHAWQLNFFAKLATHAAALNISPADTADALAAQADWNVSHPADVAAKRAARVATARKRRDRVVLTPRLRRLITRVQTSATATGGILTDMGLKKRERSGGPGSAPAPPPLGAPNILRVDAGERLRHVIHWRDAADPGRKAKPAGAEAAKIYMKVGGEAPVSTKEMTFVAVDRTSPNTQEFDAEDVGKRVYYAVLWTTSLDGDGKDGPQSEIFSAIVNG